MAVLRFKYLRTVANDNTVHFNSAVLQLLPDGHRVGYARARGEVQKRLDGGTVVVHQGRTLAPAPVLDEPVVLRARKGRHSKAACRQPTRTRIQCRSRAPDNRSPHPNENQDSDSYQAGAYPPLEDTSTDIVIEQLQLIFSLDNGTRIFERPLRRA